MEASVTWDDVKSKALTLGATKQSNGINWHWFTGFPNREAAQAFVAWLEAHDREHRGVYADATTYNVRCR